MSLSRPFLHSSLLTIPGIGHGFGTALSPSSDEWHHLTERWSWSKTRQVHGKTVAILDGTIESHHIIEADAFVTATPGVGCCVRTADCVPILVADPVRRVVAAIHAGWRGTAQNIVAETLRVMSERFGSRPADCRAAIGPAICSRCYPVGEEVVQALSQWSLSEGWCDATRHVDLVKVNVDLLVASGVPQEMIESLNVCTCCDSTFSSYRRDGERAGRQLHYILLTER